MSAAIVELVPAKVDGDLLATLDRLKTLALEGRLVGCAWIAVTAESTEYASAGDSMRLLAGTQRLAHQLNKAIDAR